MTPFEDDILYLNSTFPYFNYHLKKSGEVE